MEPRGFLLELWNAAIAAVTVGDAFVRCLPPRPRGKIIVVGAGKAAAAMAVAVARHYGPPIGGVVVTRGSTRGS